MARPAPLADLSPERRATAIRYLRGEGVVDSTDLSEGAKTLMTVGLLCCDDSGFLAKTVLDEAMKDPSIIQVARELLREASA